MITPEEILKIIGNGHGVDWLKNRYQPKKQKTLKNESL